MIITTSKLYIFFSKFNVIRNCVPFLFDDVDVDKDRLEINDESSINIGFYLQN